MCHYIDLKAVNISAYRYMDFDAASFASNYSISINTSSEVNISLIFDDEDETDERFAVEMEGPNVGDGIKRVDVTVLNNERKFVLNT